MTHARAPHHRHGRLGRTLAVFLLGALVQRSWTAIGAVHRHRRTARPAAEPRRLQRWEGEGGNVVTPQTTADATADASA